jgi:hypothetical protein
MWQIPEVNDVKALLDYFLTPRDIAGLARVRLQTVYYWAANDLIQPVISTWGRRLFDPVAVKAFLAVKRKPGRKKKKPDNPPADKEPRGE